MIQMLSTLQQTLFVLEKGFWLFFYLHEEWITLIRKFLLVITKRKLQYLGGNGSSRIGKMALISSFLLPGLKITSSGVFFLNS